MSKYQILILLNLPFVAFGFLSALIRYREHVIGRLPFILRLAFWSAIAAGLIFAKSLYEFLIGQNLTDSPPLSLADVILVTGLSFSLFLCLRLYAKAEATEKKLTEMQERLSIELSAKETIASGRKK